MAIRRSIDMGEIRANLRAFDGRANKAIEAAFDFQAARSETYMKTTAPWTDRTGHARSGLFTATKHQGDMHKLLLSHAVAYGIYLETMQAGRYGIIVRSWILASDQLWQTLSKLFAAMDGG